jgi:branched-chain amino acid transport system substrate-binding protein
VQPVACAIPGTPGSSDVGVEPDRVRLGATVPVSGPWSNLAAPALKSMQAAIQRINTSGGVCGRALELVWFDDGSDPAKAQAEIRRLVEEDRVFALVGMPSPGTLTSSLSYLEAAGVPVVGTTGADADEFASPIVWPVGPSHESFAEVVVADAYAAGARRFAVVWQDQPFGTEIRDAVAAVVSSQPDATIAAEARVSPTEPSMGPPITRMRQMCGAGGCDAVVYMLDPTNMAKWFQTEANVNGAVRGRLTTILPPHLVLRLVGGGCHIECEGLRGWAGFDLPVGGAGPAAARYLDDIRSLSGAPPDASNPFVESVYAAVVLAAEAMARTGTNLTRAGLSALLDTASFDLGLARSPLSWASSREANRSLRAYRPDATGPAFTSWVRDTDWITSP